MSAKKYHLSLDDTFNESFHLFTLYCEEESYRMAFILNQALGLKLKNTHPILRKKDNGRFQVYEYIDDTHYQKWYLLHNHSFLETKEISSGLFSNEKNVFKQKIYYHKELKKAPYLLKIIADVDALFLRNLVKKIETIPQIYTAELINLATLKNKKLLIF